MALAEIGADAKEAVPALTDALKSKEVEVRGAAAHALGEIGPGAQSVIEALTGLLKDEDAYVRLQAVWCVRKVGKVAAGTGRLVSFRKVHTLPKSLVLVGC